MTGFTRNIIGLNYSAIVESRVREISIEILVPKTDIAGLKCTGRVLQLSGAAKVDFQYQAICIFCVKMLVYFRDFFKAPD